MYAEVSTGFDKIEHLDEALPVAEFDRESLPYEAGFVAGKAFLAYRRRGGERRSPLADFYIGAHAAVRGYRLLTRDAPPLPHLLPHPGADSALTSARRARTSARASGPVHPAGKPGEAGGEIRDMYVDAIGLEDVEPGTSRWLGLWLMVRLR